MTPSSLPVIWRDERRSRNVSVFITNLPIQVRGSMYEYENGTLTNSFMMMIIGRK
jgi:hypothetical protein